MLQEAKELQLRAVSELKRRLSDEKKELTFRAPTGSGKTWMMADLMNRVLGENRNVVFLVSTLSKGNLAGQNYESFRRGAEQGMFGNIDAHLISSEVSGEEGLHIPEGHNVYVLARDLYKAGSRLAQGALLNFLREVKGGLFAKGRTREIYLIKDECHQATRNLDFLSEEFFTRVINFSATPKLSRGQMPDVQITDEEAVRAKLIKQVEIVEDEGVELEMALNKLMSIREDYRNLLGVNPCLIIQISNKDKAQEEWEQRIKPALDKRQGLKWMKIVDDKDKGCDTNDDVKKRLKVEQWKDYAKESNSTIDVIVFKMVISEGWDIPRACMLYQIRDTKSKQLDEQVLGRVRRNPRLTDFETLSPEGQQLATQAWAWGLAPKGMEHPIAVRLRRSVGIDLRQEMRVKTTRLQNLTQKQDFDIEKEIEPHTKPTHTDIFTLYKRLKQSEGDIQRLCYDYAQESVSRWWNFAEQVDKVQKKYNSYICDYAQSMVEGEETSFPVSTSYIDSGNHDEPEGWVWRRKDKGDTFAFDSEAERKWAKVLSKVARKHGAIVELPEEMDEQECYLWGKNFPQNSDIRYQYYANGIHSSYPDFVLKDKKGRIHIFEVKSVNKAAGGQIDEAEYNAKVAHLKECYKASSALLHNHRFYLPILVGADWQIYSYVGGKEDMMSVEDFALHIETD